MGRSTVLLSTLLQLCIASPLSLLWSAPFSDVGHTVVIVSPDEGTAVLSASAGTSAVISMSSGAVLWSCVDRLDSFDDAGTRMLWCVTSAVRRACVSVADGHAVDTARWDQAGTAVVRRSSDGAVLLSAPAR
jgi:hypothetical protein